VTVKESLNQRFSCRKFKDQAVPREVIDAILRQSQQTPSWCNTQPWAVDIVEGELLATLSAELVALAEAETPINPDIPFPGEYTGAFRERRKVCGLQLYQSVGIQKGDRERTKDQGLENFRFFSALHVAFISTPKSLGIYGALDCGLYISSFLLSAQELGVSTIAQAALASYPDVIRDQLRIPDDRDIVCGISFGFCDETNPVNSYRTEREDIQLTTNYHR
jgi:nitroreductase